VYDANNFGGDEQANIKAETSMIQRPQTDEYVEFYAGYIGRVPDGADVVGLLNSQPETLRALLQNITDEQASVRPAPAEWSIKEVIGHIADTERVFAYRLLRISRGDQTALPGFDQDEFVNATDFNRRSLADLLDEFEFQRRANSLLAASLTDEEIDRRGTASNNPISVRALLYILAGHVVHHIESLKTDYKVGA
jgi:uncharacterized damage-inducible protein DinB